MRKTLLVFLMLLSSFAYGQSLRSNWYVNLLAGGDILFNEDANLREKRLTPYFDLGGGNMLTPFIGFETSISGYLHHSANSSRGVYLADQKIEGEMPFGNSDPARQYSKINPDGSYNIDIMYLNAKVMLYTSLRNIIKGQYNDSCKFDVLPMLGFGYMHVFEKDGIIASNLLSCNFALRGVYHLNDKWDILAQAGCVVMPDNFEGRLMGNMHEQSINFAIGCQYNFGKKQFKSRKELEPIEKLIHDTVFVDVPKVDTVYIEPQVDMASNAKEFKRDSLIVTAMFFNINSSNIDASQELQLKTIANFIEQNPESEIILQGYADKQTGSKEYNQNLSLKRANAVKDKLVKDYKIDANKIKTMGIGTESQPYSQYKYNRAVLVIAK